MTILFDLRLTALMGIFFSFLLHIRAQAPESIPYQAVARDASGNLLQNQPVGLRFSIRDGSALGTVVYQETHATTTNALGLFSVNIGQGIPVSGTFGAINWGSGPKFSQVELDPAGGTSYADMGTFQMLSVPYALYAAQSGSAANETDPQVGSATTNAVPKWNGTTLTDGLIHDDGTNVGIGTASPAYKLDIQSSGIATASVQSSGSPAYTQMVAPSAEEAATVLATYSAGSPSTRWLIGKSNNPESGSNEGSNFFINRYSDSGDFIDQPFYIQRSTGYIGIRNYLPFSLLANTSTNIVGQNGQGVTQKGITWATSAPGYAGAFFNSSTNANAQGLAVKTAGTAGTIRLLDLSTGSSQASAGTTVMVVQADGKTGIGTASPSQKLDVAGTTKTTNFQLTNGASNGYILQSDAAGNGSWVSPLAVFTDTDDQSLSLTGTTLGIDNGNSVDLSVLADNFGNHTATQNLQTNGHWLSNDGGDEGLFVKSDGKVGIGTNNPATELHIKDSNTPTLRLEQSGDSFSPYTWDIGANEANFFVRDLTFGGDKLPFRIYPGNNSNRIAIKDDNVGIGTNSPAALLDVNGATKTVGFQMPTGAANGYVLQSDASGNGSWVNPTSLSIAETDPKVNSSATGQVPRWTGTTLSDGTIFDNGTNVGIGTNSPAALLDVNGATKTVGFQMPTGAANGYVLQSDASGNGSWVNPSSLSIAETDPQVNSSATGQVPRWTGTTLSDGTIFDNGTNVGIGTTSPAEKLDVSGTTKTTNFQMTNGAASGYVLQSDASGNGTWVDASSLSGVIRNIGNSRFIGYTSGKDAEGLLFGNSSQEDVIALGDNAGYSAGSFGNLSNNIALGKNTLYGLTGGVGNIAIGTNVLATAFGTYFFNTAIGYKALSLNGNPLGNTALGAFALSNSAASGNTGLGYEAGKTISSGTNNTFLGRGADAGSSSLTNATAIGYNAVVNTSNSLVLGNNANVGIGTSSPSSKLEVSGTTKTTNFQMTNGAASGYVLQSDASGNASWVDPTGFSITEADPQVSSSTTGRVPRWTGSTLSDGTIFDNGTNVGIGTISPANKLDVEGGIAIGSTYSGTSAAPTNGVIIEGNVGIGTTSPEAKLAVNGDVVVDQSGTNIGTLANGALLFGGGGSGEAIASCRTNAGNQFGLDFYTSSINRMSIDFNGRVGIGTTSPTQAKLVVNGSVNRDIGGYGFINDNGNTGTSSGIHSYSIYASDRVAGSEFNAHSDARIKRIRGRSDNAADLETLMQLKITDYTLIDTVTKGNKPYKKVIAQEVEQVYPQAVSTLASVAVPDIYQLSKIENGFVALENSGLKTGERVKLIFGEKQEIAEVTAVTSTGFQTTLKAETGQVFVFGREVSDFRTVDYEALSMLNVSATQELVKQLGTLQKQNTALQDRVSRQENTLDKLQQQISALEVFVKGKPGN